MHRVRPERNPGTDRFDPTGPFHHPDVHPRVDEHSRDG